MSKYKILGIISILLFIIGWILYSKLGIIIAYLHKNVKKTYFLIYTSMCQVNVGNFFIFFSNPLNAIAFNTLFIF